MAEPHALTEKGLMVSFNLRVEPSNPEFYPSKIEMTSMFCCHGVWSFYHLKGVGSEKHDTVCLGAYECLVMLSW